MAINPNSYCDALCYYLDHIRVELNHGRMNFLRHFIDSISALTNGYISQGVAYKGNWGEFKRSWYASNQALSLINKNSSWSIHGQPLCMEHVVPLNVVGQILLAANKTAPYTNAALLADIRKWVIPCLITKTQDNALSSAGFHSSMPVLPPWNQHAPNAAWARYQQTLLSGVPLINDIAYVYAPPIPGLITTPSTIFPPWKPIKPLPECTCKPLCACCGEAGRDTECGALKPHSHAARGNERNAIPGGGDSTE